MERVNNFLLGCDPEFVGINNGALMNHNRTFRHEGPVGWDHNGWVLEVRPEPAYFVQTLVRRIARLLKDERVLALPKARAGAYWRNGERNYALGGHVHVGVDPYVATSAAVSLSYEEAIANRHIMPNTTRETFERHRPSLERLLAGRERVSSEHRDRIGALDTFTMQLEHLDILPARESELRRDSTAYGKYGDVRIQGEPPRTEYRTMGSWLMSPSVAMVCLTGAKIAASDPGGITKGNVNYAGLKSWFEKYKQDKDVSFMQKYILSKPLKTLQVDPDGDFREKWGRVRCPD